MKTPAGGIAWLTIGLSCSLMAAVAISIVGTFVLPEFSSAYQASGAELPLVTRLFMRSYLLVWIAPIVVVAAWCLWPSAAHRGKIAGMIGLGTLVLSVPFAVFALYLPMFGLPATI